MSTVVQNPNSHPQNGSVAVKVTPAEEKSLTKLDEEPVKLAIVQHPVSTMLCSVTNGLNKTIKQAYFAISAIIGVGVILFMMGAVAIVFYLSTHPMHYKSNELENFSLKRILIDESEVAPINPINPPQSSSAIVTPDKASQATLTKDNHQAGDDAVAIQPNMIAPKPVTQMTPNTQHANIPKLKNEPTVTPSTIIVPATIDGHEAKAKNKTSEDNTKIQKSNISSLKPLTEAKEQARNEALCNQAMRSLNQCH